MIMVAVCGACGCMGQSIVKTISGLEDMKVVAAIDKPGISEVGEDAGEIVGVGEIGVEIAGADELGPILEEADPDVLVDFTVAEAAVENVKISAESGVPVVVGTTGFSDEQRNELRAAVDRNNIPAVISSNMSVGVNVFFKLIEEASEIIGDYDMELVEKHHNEKVDAPSGTALTAAQIAAEASGKDFNSVARFGRGKGNLGERPDEEIGIHAVRAGNISGDHDFIFAGPNEMLKVSHRAQSRQAFVDGVVKAIRYIEEEGVPGKVQDMQDVLFSD